MLVLFQPDMRADGSEVQGLLAHLEQYPGRTA